MEPLEYELEKLFREDYSSVIERESKDFDYQALPFEKSIVLVGAGNLGRKVLAVLREDGIEPLVFADDNPVLQGKSIDGIKVLSHQQAADKYGNKAAFVITIWNTSHSFVQTRKELLALNCKIVISSIFLRWKYSKELLPFFWLDVPSKTYKNSHLIKSAFSLWGDELSRKEYIAQLKFRIYGEFDTLAAPVQQESYFPDDLFEIISDEKFVDCGAFDGITIKHLLDRQKIFIGGVIAYEPDPINFTLLKQFVSNQKNSIREKIIPLPYAVGSNKGRVHFDPTGTMSSSIANNGKIEVECVTIDDNLAELQFTPSFIKMDIEGNELEALIGAQCIIQKARPILAICLYHRYDDLWQIPLFINLLGCDYHLFLRPHEIEGWQLVCYAVPNERLRL